MDLTTEIAARYADVTATIERARAVFAALHKREPQDVCLIAVSKRQPIERIEALLACGHRHFGENQVQEAIGKWPALKEKYPDVILHFVGSLQSNKVRDAVGLFDAIHSVDRPKLARALASEIHQTQSSPVLFVQVNTGEESQKSGVVPLETDAFLQTCREELGLEISGLMCIPPKDEEASLHFALLKKIAARNALPFLSMGMSEDFELAVELGATHVRVGTSLFGARES